MTDNDPEAAAEPSVIDDIDAEKWNLPLTRGQFYGLAQNLRSMIFASITHHHALRRGDKAEANDAFEMVRSSDNRLQSYLDRLVRKELEDD